MKYFTFLIIVNSFLACNSDNNSKKQENDSYAFFVGTYTNNNSEGIYKYILHGDGKLELIGLAAKSENPSFLTISDDNKFLITINELNINNQGTVESYLISDDSLAFLSKSLSGGAHPCFVSINKEKYILTANYTGGNIGLLHLNDKGKLSKLLDVQQHSGSGTTKRQQAPHAHSAWFSQVDSSVITVDLGTNQLWFYHLDSKLQKLIPNTPETLTMNPGAGPRHLTFHPNGKWIYVVNELDCTIALVLRNKEGKYKIINTISTLPKEYIENNTSADIKISNDGKFVYASNRGHNSIAIFKVNTNNGSLKLIGHESTKGDGPRNFSLSPDNKYLLVANQRTNNIVSFERNKTSGLLKYIDQIEAPTPVCIVF